MQSSPCWPPEGQVTLALLSERVRASTRTAGGTCPSKHVPKEALQKLVAALGFTVGAAPDGSRVKLYAISEVQRELCARGLQLGTAEPALSSLHHAEDASTSHLESPATDVAARPKAIAGYCYDEAKQRYFKIVEGAGARAYDRSCFASPAAEHIACLHPSSLLADTSAQSRCSAFFPLRGCVQTSARTAHHGPRNRHLQHAPAQARAGWRSYIAHA
jgi:hypothetical protein